MDIRPLTVGSVCTGYGGLEMALNAVFNGNIDVRWHAENDPDASAVLKRWWDVPNLGDFTTPGFWDTAEVTEVQVGGIPCQPFSQAGRKHGTADHRYLWPQWWEGIQRHRPRLVVFENVVNLVYGTLRPVFDAITASLAGVGYHVRWCRIGACAVGAAHHRHRVFMVAKLSRSDGSCHEVPVTMCGKDGLYLLPTSRGRDWKQGRSYEDTLPVTINTLFPTVRAREGTGGPGHGKNKMGGDSLVTVVSRELSTLLPSPRASDAAKGSPNQGIASGDIALSSAVQPERFGRYADAVRRHAGILGRPAPEPVETGPRGAPRLTARFSEWLMMLPEGHLTSVLGRNAAITRAGNGVVPLQAATALRLLLRDLDEGPP
jgi:DNA (cytosine-5)-methyltransferase 1